MKKENLQWRTSQISGGNGACVEVGAADPIVAVRDSKDQRGSTLVYNRNAWGHFIAGIKAGNLIPK